MKGKQKFTQETVELGGVVARVELDASTVDLATRTVDAVFYSGAPVLRFSFFDGPYELQFEVSKKAADLSRLNNGAALIDSHNAYRGIESQLGVVEKAWIEDGQARASVRFSKRPEVEAIWQDVQDRVIRNVSMGTYLREMKEITEEDAEMKRFLVTSWEPYEISLVGIPADPGATIEAAADTEKRPCRITFRAEALADAQIGDEQMQIQVRLLADCEYGKSGEIVEIDEANFDETLHTKELEGGGATGAAEPATVSVSAPAAAVRTVDAAIDRDRGIASEINRVATHYGLDRLWVQRQINQGTSIEQVLKDAADERARRSPRTPNDIGFGDDFEAQHWHSDRIVEALAARAVRQAPPEPAQQYERMSLVEAALQCLTWSRRARGLDARRDVSQIVKMALHTTSDFPLLLANVLNKILMPAYENAQPTYRGLAVQRTFNDFRAHRFDRSGDFPVPLQVNEHGEYKYGTMGENQEQVTLLKFGRIIGLSYETIVNDDLDAFSNMAVKAGVRVADFENATFFSTCITAAAGLGPDLSDSVAVYNAAHGNVTGAGALTDVLLDAGRALMMAQTSIDGIILNVIPTILLVSPASYGLAERLTAPASVLVGQGLNAAAVPNINPWAGKLAPVADANLTGTRFYMLADPSRLAQYIYGYLGGASGPRVETRAGFETDGVEFKVALEFGTGAIEYRAGVTGAGA